MSSSTASGMQTAVSSFMSTTEPQSMPFAKDEAAPLLDAARAGAALDSVSVERIPYLGWVSGSQIHKYTGIQVLIPPIMLAYFRMTLEMDSRQR